VNKVKRALTCLLYVLRSRCDASTEKYEDAEAQQCESGGMATERTRITSIKHRISAKSLSRGKGLSDSFTSAFLGRSFSLDCTVLHGITSPVMSEWCQVVWVPRRGEDSRGL